MIKGKLQEFARQQDGAATLELAFALPVLALLMVGMLEVAMLLFSQVLAEGGLRQASRYGITGNTETGSTREEQIINIVMEHSHGLLDITTSDVEILVYPSFTDIGEPEPLIDDFNGNGEYDAGDGDTYDDVNGNATWDPDMGDPGPGGSGEVVLYRLEYEWDFMTPIFRVFGGPNGAVDMQASIAVQNEPYDIE